jgi:dihydroneopterin aldolase
MPDQILIDNLELSAQIGITAEERALAQRLTVTLQLQPSRNFTRLEDRIENTVDYFNVCAVAKEIAAARPRYLLETLAEEIAAGVLEKFPVQALEVELRKYILPDTRFVAVKIHRENEKLLSPKRG